jgi:hypothetical protein
VIGKYAGEWNTNKKQDFFRRKICNFYSGDVIRIKSPDPLPVK